MSNKRPTMTSTLNEKRNELLKQLTSSFSTTGLATEATQLLVLSTLQSLFAEQKVDFELKCVEDANGDIFQLRISVDEPSGVYTVDYIDATGAVATPVAPIQFCSPNDLLNSILTELTTLNATDFATAANQALAIAELQSIVTNTSDVATETTLAAFLAAFSGTDFATETTLAALTATDFATEATLSAQAANILALLNAFNAEDFASETTLAALSTAFGATDFATETTLAALAAEDFATETTLASVLSEVQKIVGFALGEYDEIDITYIAAGNGAGEIGTVVYSFATVVQYTLTLTYDASNRLINVLKS